MKKPILLLVSISLLLAISACTAKAENTQNAGNQITTNHVEEGQDHSEIFPYMGIWFSKDRSSQLIITEAYLYFHEFSTGREVYAEIRAVDLTVNQMEVVMYDIIHSGLHVGFDNPTEELVYQINGEEMQITLGRLRVSAEADPVIFYRDEVLTP